MAITIAHTYICDVCGLRITRHLASDDYPAEPGFMERKDLPKSWTWVSHSLVCHRHTMFVSKEHGESELTMLRRGYKDDESGYHPEEIAEFDEPWPDGVNPPFSVVRDVLIDSALDPLTWVTMRGPTPPIDLASTPPDKVP